MKIDSSRLLESFDALDEEEKLLVADLLGTLGACYAHIGEKSLKLDQKSLDAICSKLTEFLKKLYQVLNMLKKPEINAARFNTINSQLNI